MKNKTKNIIIVFFFLIILIGGLFINYFVEDKQVSTAERRKLAQFPTITTDNVLDGKFASSFETYAMDQFIFRDLFRAIKTFVSFNVLQQKDNNDLFIYDGGIYKLSGELKETEIEKATNKFSNIQDKYFRNSNMYYTIVPDKNYYIDTLKMDYEKLEEIMNKNLEMKYIDIFDILDKDDYYKTDLHWKQENLIEVAKKFGDEMDVEIKLEDIEVKDKGDFYGAYYGQLANLLGNAQVDKLKYVTNNYIDNATTYNVETQKTGNVYDEEKLKTSSDKYDFYLSGATAIITIENSLATTDKELVMFRDSFGSSIAPLLIEGYSKITLIDIRYISSDYLEDFCNLNDSQNTDVLFLYSTLLLNQSSVLR